MSNSANFVIPQAAIQVKLDATPIVSLAENITPNLTGGTTNAKVYDQGYTYNQSGFTYNQAGVAYGGVYNVDQDIVPLVSLAQQPYPIIFGNSDIYTPGQRESAGMLMGILGLTYPTDGVLF